MRIKPSDTLLTEQLTAEIRAFKAPELARYIIKRQLLEELIRCALHPDHLLSSRAMWVLGHCSDIEYNSIRKYHGRLIENLSRQDLHNGVIRNTLRLYQQYPVPEAYQAFLLDLCHGYIQDPAQAIAVRSFAITVVFNISKPYPELLSELRTVLEQLPAGDEPAGIRSKVKNTLKAIDKLLMK